MPESIPAVTPDLPSRSWRLTLSLLERLPQAGLSRGLGRLADVPIPRSLRRTILGRAANVLGIDLSEAELPLEEYGSLNALFVRRLRPGTRAWQNDPRTIGSPVDGILGQLGHAHDGRLVQAKGRHYRVDELLGGIDAGRFRAGSFCTLYLSPRHYHRIHSACTGSITDAWHVPGALLPVNEAAVMHVDNLFPRNERLACVMDTAFGRVAIVAVGAYNVGRISAAFDPRWSGERGEQWVTNRPGGTAADARRYEPPIRIQQGDEIMAFHLGSTVVLVTEQRLSFAEGIEAGKEVRLGDRIASV
jgi:phosphatidylserine decarboxylase